MDGEALTVRLNGMELLPKALVALTVNVDTPNPVNVPLIPPVDAFNVSPAGSEPLVTAHVIGVLPEAAKVWE
jgi:hypothetical protein